MKSQIIRNAFISLVTALLCQPVTSQYMWSTPQPITDSIADNRNAVVVELLLHGTWGNYIFWERSGDTTATAIYYRNLYAADETTAMHETANVHYRNPRFISTSWTDDDTLCYFFYESDEGGNYDIYYQILTLDGFTEPQFLANSAVDESHFRCSGSGAMTWQEDDKIKYALLEKNWNGPFTLSSSVTVDSIACFSPDLPDDYFGATPYYIAWLKGDSGQAAVYYSERTWPDGTWSSPMLLTDEGNNQSLRFSANPCYGATNMGDFLVWDQVANGEHTIRIHNMYEGDFTGEFQQQSPFMPVYGDYIVPMDADEFYGYMTFVNSQSGDGDIYVNDYEWPLPGNLEGYVNLSDSPNEDSHPDLFNGRCHDYWCDLVLTFESYRNDHWQIFYSTSELMCAGGTQESEKSEPINLQLSPNPASSSCDISYTLQRNEYVSLSMISPLGQKFEVFERKFQGQGAHTIHLEFGSISSGTLQPGIYLVRLQTGNRVECRKLVIAR